MPSDGKPVRVQVSKGTAVILGAERPAAPPQPTAVARSVELRKPRCAALRPGEG